MIDFTDLYLAARNKILAADNIAIITHINPDGDCTGSAIALRELIKVLGKDADIYNENVCPSFMDFLCGDTVFNRFEENDGIYYDLNIFIDCGGKDRAGNVSWVCKNCTCTINIDHHGTNPMYGDINIVDGSASATGLLIYDFYKACGVNFTKYTSELIYVALMMDTGNFSYSNTDKKTHIVAGELLEYGIDTAMLSQKLFRTTTYNRLKLTAKAFETLKMYCNGKIAVINVTKAMYRDTNTDSSDSEGFVGTVRDIEGVDIAVLLRDTTDGKLVKVSFRSNNDIDVSKIAEEFKGGGHFNAAGCSIEGKIPEVENIVINRLSELYK